LELVLDQIRQVEAERDAVLDAAKHNETNVMAQLLTWRLNRRIVLQGEYGKD
jgi:Iap family predicted aminopeptidase